jgi:hypothetical protein
MTNAAAKYIVDGLTRERHARTRDDVRRMITRFDAIPEIDVVFDTITPSDVDQRAGGLEIARTVFAHGRKHLQTRVFASGQVPVFTRTSSWRRRGYGSS